MFQASLCPSSGAYQLQQQPLVYRRNVVVAVLLVVVGPVVFINREIKGKIFNISGGDTVGHCEKKRKIM
jgi:hypothetical protein